MQQRAIEMASERFDRARQQQQQQANYERQVARQQQLDAEALRRQSVIDAQNERYLNWQMGGGGRVPTGVVTDAARQARIDAVTTGNPVPAATRNIIGEEIARSIDAEAMAARPGIRRDYARSLDIANTENLRTSDKKRVAEADKAVKDAGWTRKLWSRLIPFYELPEYGWQRAAKERAALNEGRYPAAPRADLEAYTERGRGGRYEPAMDIQPWLEQEMGIRRGTPAGPAPRSAVPARTSTPGYWPMFNGFGGSPGMLSPTYVAPGWAPTNLPPTRSMTGRVPAYAVPEMDMPGAVSPYGDTMVPPRGYVPPIDELGAASPYGDEMIPPRSTPKVVVQNGNRYAMQPDGSYAYLGPAQ